VSLAQLAAGERFLQALATAELEALVSGPSTPSGPRA
jgi:hypothetical protein